MSTRFSEVRDLTQAVKVSWLGHAMFLLEDGAGNRLVTDPYGEGVGYDLPSVEAGIVLVSHEHFDHGNVALVKGSPVVISEAGEHEVAGVRVAGYPTFHDANKGSERGGNVVYRWEMQGLSFVHLGDLGHALDQDLAGKLAGTDVLFVPVGGTFTIDDAGAFQVVEALKPRVAIPMHFKNDACGFPIQSEEPFVSRFASVERAGKAPVYFSRDALPEPTLILVMDYL